MRGIRSFDFKDDPEGLRMFWERGDPSLKWRVEKELRKKKRISLNELYELLDDLKIYMELLLPVLAKKREIHIPRGEKFGLMMEEMFEKIEKDFF